MMTPTCRTSAARQAASRGPVALAVLVSLVAGLLTLLSPGTSYAQAERHNAATFNMRYNVDRWQHGAYSIAKKVEILALQEVPDGMPPDAEHANGRHVGQQTQINGFTVDRYKWTNCTDRPGGPACVIYRLTTHRKHRSLALVVNQPTDEITDINVIPPQPITPGRPVDGDSKPALGVQLQDGTWFYSVHGKNRTSSTNQSNDVPGLVGAISQASGNDWAVMGDFNRTPDSLNPVPGGGEIVRSARPTHPVGNPNDELDYMITHGLPAGHQYRGFRLTYEDSSDHYPVMFRTSTDTSGQICDEDAPLPLRSGSASQRSDRAGGLCPDKPKAIVSMGDSYISGEAGRWQGNGFNGQYSYKAKEGSAYGTDRTAFDCTGSGVDEKCEHDPKRVYGNTGEGEEMCHRSDVAPIKSIGDELGIPQKRRFNIACSGATTEDVTSRTFKGEKPQVEQLAELAGRYRLTYVVLSIGGNDLGFSEIAQDCVLGYEGNRPCSDNGREEVADKLGDVREAVNTAVNEVQETLSGAGQDRTKIIIQGYPNPVPPARRMRYENEGWQRESLGGCPLLDKDVDWLHDEVVPGLNRRLASVAQSRDVVFLNTESAFAGHQLCDRFASQAGKDDTRDNPPDAAATEWVRWIPGLMDWFPWTQGETQEAAHPNAFGQQALGICLRKTMEATRDGSKGPFDCRGAPSTGPDKVQVSEQGIQQSVRLMPLGDSITEGVGSSHHNGYRKVLYDALESDVGDGNVNFVGSVRRGNMSDPNNEGHRGKRIDEIASFAHCYARVYQPNVITLHAGTNDFNQNYPSSTALQRIRALIKQTLADSPRAVIVLAKVIPTGKDDMQASIDAFNAKLPGLVSEFRADGKHIVLTDTSDLNVSDGLQNDAHPNDEGYAKLGNDFHTGVMEAADKGWIKKPAAEKPATKCKREDPDEDQSKAGPGWRALGVVAPGMTHPSGHTDLADFDGDGRDDYVRVDEKNHTLRIALNLKSKKPGFPQWKEVRTDVSDNLGLIWDKGWKLHFADIDGDGMDDIVVVPPSGSKEAVRNILNQGLTSSGRDILWSGPGPIGLTLDHVPQEAVRFADVNGDGRDDYLRVGKDGSVHAYYNLESDTGGWEWKEHRNWAPGVFYGSRSRLRLADVNGDGKADYLMVGKRGAVHAYINNGDKARRRFTEHRYFVKETGYPGDETTFRDISGDGKADYVVVYDGGSVRAWFNRGGNM
jgi:lysophospholipase L1-like esterase/endonuclease/exonuclease/phosphatase family metal-dependent hydrolase